MPDKTAVSNRNAAAVLGGIAIAGTAGALAAFAAKQAKEVELQEEIAVRLAELSGVESAYVDVQRPYFPWQRSRVTGGVCIAASGIDEVEERFDACVHAVRAVMDNHNDFTADIVLKAEPVDPTPYMQDHVKEMA